MNETEHKPMTCPLCHWKGAAADCKRSGFESRIKYCPQCVSDGRLTEAVGLVPESIPNVKEELQTDPDKRPLWRTSCTCGWDLHDDDSVTRCPDCGARFLKRERFPDTPKAPPEVPKSPLGMPEPPQNPQEAFLEADSASYLAWRHHMKQQRLDACFLAERAGCASVSAQIECAIHRARVKHPDWPTDPLHAFAIIAEEFGEAAKEGLQLVYEPTPGGLDRLRTEVAQMAAVCHRFLESMDRYEFKPSAQHRQ